MAAHKVANALAAGCPTILKPSEWAPYGSTALVEAVVEALDAAGAPTSLLQLVHGGATVGTQLVEDRRTRAISFTGGLGGGRAIAAACAQDFKPAQLELGGNNSLVVLDHATPEAAAAAVVGLMTSLNGQWCRALGRLVLPAARADELLQAALDALATVRIGSSLDVESQMGPIVHSAHLDLLRRRVSELEAAGGKAHATTALPEGEGNWMAPTLVTGLGLEDSVHETFGPVAAVHTYESVDEAVAIANGTPYGLEAYVVGSDEEAALAFARRIRAGGVKVNGVSPISLHIMAPRPAWGLSGTGVEGTRETLQFFTGLQVVGVEGSLPT
jgi:phenylacetaldehyde dehydrogenase